MQNKISCIIVDDEPDAIELLSNRLRILFKNIIIVRTCSGWGDALEALREEKFDLLFTDISMPEKNAIDLLKLLPELDSEIIFVTAHERYALSAFAFPTSGYILKPIDDSDLSAAINKALIRIHNKRLAGNNQNVTTSKKDKIGIPNNHGIDYVNINDILYLESVNKCTKIVTPTSNHFSSYNLGKFKNLIDSHSFYQVHRSYIINTNSILRYESSGLVIMSNKKEIPVSRNIRNDFLNVLSGNF